MFYCDMGPKGARIRTSYTTNRRVGQYVTVNNRLLSNALAYQARTIVTLTTNGNMIWFKHRDRPESALLTKEEQDAMFLQILKSEVW